jgi:IS1 family transposase
MWSFVFCKKIKVYIWLAIDRSTREIIGCYLGDRSRKSARKLWESLLGVYRQYAVAYTDFWDSYKTVIPPQRHARSGKRKWSN